MNVGDWIEVLERIAPPDKAAAWDPVGLQLGDPRAVVQRLAVCHEVTEEVVSVLEREPADLRVRYHPLLFEPQVRWLAGSDAAGRALDAVARIGAGVIGRYSHCSFRSEGMGTYLPGLGSQPAAGSPGQLQREREVRLELAAPRALEARPRHARVAAHPYEEPAIDVVDRRGELGLVGRIGGLSRESSLASFAEHGATRLACGRVHWAGDSARRVKSVAVVPGSGLEFAAPAGELGAEVLVTGDARHHRVRAALDRGVAIVDPGHVATERPGLRALHAQLREIDPKVRSLLDLDPDPWSG